MKKLQRYVLGGVVKSLLAAFAALVLLMVVGMCMQMLHEGLDVVRLHSLLPPMFAYCVPVVLPSALLAAVILSFGRLSADNELIALQAAGIPLWRVVYPVLVGAVLMSAVAAAFQFEVVPRARGAIEALKYDMLKQMLLDKVALTHKRQFSFPPVHIQYEDFRDGKLRDVVVMEVRGGRLRTIVSAESSTVAPDPQRDELVVFQMSDCTITRFDMQQAGQARTVNSETVIYWVRMAPEEEKILSHRKYLPLLHLLGRLNTLRRKVARQRTFENPQLVASQQRKERDRLDSLIAELEGTVSAVRERLHKYGQERPRRQRQLVERYTEEIENAQARLEELQEQQAAYVKQFDQMETEQGDLEAQVRLHEQRRKVLRDIEQTRQTIEARQADLQEARRAIRQAQRRAEQLEARLAELEAQDSELMKQRQQMDRVLAWADDQHDLRAIRIRIHKRLAQAAAVFIFALLGVPLGIVASRRSVMVAFGLSFAVVLLVFYPSLILGQAAAEAGSLPVAPALWGGNALTFLIGLILTGRALSR